MPTTIFQTQVEAELMQKAIEVLASDGITVADAFNRLVRYIVVVRRMPYLEYFEPNETTLAAMAEATQGDLVTTGSVAELMAELNEDD